MADVKIRSTLLTIPGSTGSSNHTITGFGYTPKAAIFITPGINATADVGKNDAHFGIGFADGTNNFSFCFVDNDSEATTKTANAQRNDSCCIRLDPGGGIIDYAFSVTGFIADGVTINVSNAPFSERLVTMILIGGDDVTYAEVLEIDDLGAGANTVPVTSLSGEPDLLFTVMGESTANGIDQTTIKCAFGLCHNDGLDTQRYTYYYSEDGVGTSNTQSRIDNTGIGIYGSTIQTFDATGFDIDVSFNASNSIMGILALKFANSPGIDLFDMSWPTTGNYAETNPAFTPQFGMIWSAVSPTARNTTTNDDATISCMVFDEDVIYSTNASSQDVQTTSRAFSRLDSTGRVLGGDGTIVSVLASDYAFDSSGWDFTLSTNPVTNPVLGYGLAIEESATIIINSVDIDPATGWDWVAYDGGLIPPNSIMFHETGSHAGADAATYLSVSGTPWTTNQWSGFKIRNTTDGSEGVISTNSTNAITAYSTAMTGGTNTWDTDDVYEIVQDMASSDEIVYETATDNGGTVSAMSTKGVPTITGASGTHSFDVKYRDATDSKVSSTVTVTVTV